MTILTNNFHGTDYRTHKTRDELEAIADRVARAFPGEAKTDKAFVRRVRRALCGCDGCTCARNVFGEY